MDISNILSKVKTSMRITTNDFDSDITDLINSALKDLGVAGVEVPYETQEEVQSLTDELVINAIKTYCKLNFGDAIGNEWDRLKASYDEQKAQLSMASGYTNWQ